MQYAVFNAVRRLNIRPAERRSCMQAQGLDSLGWGLEEAKRFVIHG